MSILKIIIFTFLKFIITVFCVFSTYITFSQSPELWGLASEGGKYGAGTVFKLDENGENFSEVHAFVKYTGKDPVYGKLCLARNGLLYGLTVKGGKNDKGVLFSFDPSEDTYKEYINFSGEDNGAYPYGTLIQAENGLLYGLTRRGGLNDDGTLFQFDIESSTLTKLFDFSEAESGAYPYGSPIQASNGQLYGLTFQGGENFGGTIFEYNIENDIFTKKIGLGPDGRNPIGSLIEALDGKLYGTAANGGIGGYGVIFEYDIESNNYQKLSNFEQTTRGAHPYGDLIQLEGGRFFGLTPYGGEFDKGVLFEYDIETKSIIKRADLNTRPFGNLTLATNKKLYASTFYGGDRNIGSIIEYDPDRNVLEEVLSFSSYKSGYHPKGSLTQADNGLFYGMTSDGGNEWGDYDNGGLLFEFDPSNYRLNSIFEFGDGVAINPDGKLLQASNGNIYGTTLNGGKNDAGVLFEIQIESRKLTVIHNFNKEYSPTGSLVETSFGKLYGSTINGGDFGKGSVFSYDLISQEYSKVADFDGQNGSKPKSGLIVTSNNKIFGVASEGGEHNFGVLYEFDITNNSIIPRSHFTGVSNGSFPIEPPTEVTNGFLYGLTNLGGINDDGTLYEYNTETGELKSLIDLSSSSTGSMPFGRLTEASNRKLYGMMSNGGSKFFGALVEYDISSNQLEIKYDFSEDELNPNAKGGLIDHNGKLYGLTKRSGENDGGIIFEYDIETGSFLKKHDFQEETGIGPNLMTLIKVEYKETAEVSLLLEDKIYGDDNFEPIVESTSNGAINFIGSDLVYFDSKSAIIQGAGTATIVVTQEETADYYGSFSSEVFEIFKAELNASTTDFEKKYGEENPSFTVYYDGFIGDDDESTLDSAPEPSTVAHEFSEVGEYAISLSEGLDNNYEIVIQEEGILIVGKAELIVTTNDYDKIYGEENPSLLINYEGFVGEDDESIIDMVPLANTEGSQFSDVGEYAINLSEGFDNNYELINEEGAILTINKSSITATIDNYTKKYGEENPSIRVNYNGFVGNENESVLDEVPQAIPDADIYSETGEYSIFLVGGFDNNYEIELGSKSSLFIEKASLFFWIEDISITEGDQIPDFEIKYEGFLNDDDVMDLDNPPSATTTADESSQAGEYDIILSSGSDNNYSISVENGKLIIEGVKGEENEDEEDVILDIINYSESHENIYPNPVVDRFQFTDSTIEEALLFSLNGKRIKALVSKNKEFNVSELAPGTYIIVAKGLTQNYISRLIKK